MTLFVDGAVYDKSWASAETATRGLGQLSPACALDGPPEALTIDGSVEFRLEEGWTAHYLPDKAIDRALFGAAATSGDALVAEASRMRAPGPRFTRVSDKDLEAAIKPPPVVDDDDLLEEMVSSSAWLGDPSSDGGAVALIVDGVQFNGAEWREVGQLACTLESVLFIMLRVVERDALALECAPILNHYDLNRCGGNARHAHQAAATVVSITPSRRLNHFCGLLRRGAWDRPASHASGCDRGFADGHIV